MTSNKRFNSLIFTTIVLPYLLSFLNWKYSSYDNFRWGYDHINQLSIMGIAIAVLGSGLVLYLNNKEGKNKSWNIIGGLLLVFNLVYLYIAYNFSHFGF